MVDHHASGHHLICWCRIVDRATSPNWPRTLTQPLTKAELLERLRANPRFKEASPGAAVVIVGARASDKPILTATRAGPAVAQRSQHDGDDRGS